MTTYRKPGVYVEENKIFPPDVTEVETAVPAFIGYTQIAKKAEDNDLILKPVKIYSLKEYNSFFGYPQGATLGSLQPMNGSLYNFIRIELQNHFVVLPAGGTVAGVYAAVDTVHGVWKAPANVSLVGVIEPVIKIDKAYQGELNIDAVTGKSINAIRTFEGKGTLIRGARTLAGNDNE